MNNINNFHTNGYDILSNEVPRETIDYLKSYTLELKNRMISDPKFETDTKPNGSGVYGRFHDSRIIVTTYEIDSENKKLFNVYTSQLMYEIYRIYLMRDKIYLFNESGGQTSNEEFSFEPHRDNQFAFQIDGI